MNGVIAAARGAGEEGEWDFGDEMVASLVEAMLTALSSTDAIPVLDEGASGLARAMRDGGLLESQSSLGKAEIATVAGLMGNLPHLSEAPLDQVVSLRTKLQDPLTRFRSAVSNMSAHFASEIYDESLALEIQLAWRQEVAPALLEIREVLREEGLLRSLRDVAMENPTRLLSGPAGGFLMGHAAIGGLSQQVLTAIALPLGDAATRALRRSMQGQRDVQRNDFYFFHAADLGAA